MPRRVAALVLFLMFAGICAALSDCGVRAEDVPCGDRAVIVVNAGKLGEAVVSRGLADDGTVFELLRAPDGSWSLLSSDVSGVSCVMATGAGWETVDPPPKPAGPAL